MPENEPGEATGQAHNAACVVVENTPPEDSDDDEDDAPDAAGR